MMTPIRHRSMELADRIFLAIIALIMVGIIVAFDFDGTISKENRALAARPVLYADGDINGNIIGEIDLYISDRFGFRDTLVSWNTDISLNVFGVSPSDKVLIGKNDFLFYVSKSDGDNLSDFLKRNRFSSTELQAIKAGLEEQASWCKENGIEFLFVTAPSKHSIYAEHYPFARPAGVSRLGETVNFVNAKSETKMLDFRETLLKAKESQPVYPVAGTHWNENGAFAAYKVIFDEVKSRFPRTRFKDNPQYAMESALARDQGIYNMIGRKNTEQFVSIGLEPTDDHPYTFEKSDGRDPIITVHRDTSLPRAMIFRDSFFSALQPFTSNIFSRATYRWKLFEKSDRQRVLDEKVDIVIFEVTERYMHKLVWLYQQ